MVSLVLLLPFALLWGSRYRRATAFVAQDAFAKMKAVEISPFGIFRTSMRFRFIGSSMTARVYCLGDVDTTILQQVDCLMALGRRIEAIALLECNLDLDGWRGKLRRHLLDLGGRHLRALQ
jgi:hypothetical protein